MKQFFVICALLSAVKLSGPVSVVQVNSMLQVFSPVSLIRFFEFSDQGWNITMDCIKDMYAYLDGLQHDQRWAIKLFDASGYYSGGFFAGNLFRIISPEYCGRLDRETMTARVPTKFNAFENRRHRHNETTTDIVPFRTRSIVANYKMAMTYSSNHLTQTVCMPASCSISDLQQILSYTSVAVNSKDTVYMGGNVELDFVKILNEQYLFYEDNYFYLLIILITIVLCLSMIAQIYERISVKIAGKNNDAIVSGTGSEGVSAATYLRSPIDEPSVPAMISKLNLDKINMKNLNNLEQSLYTNLRMHPLAESMTINNINTNSHMNLVKVKKIGTHDVSTISLDIISGNCSGNKVKTSKKFSQATGSIFGKTILAFSIQRNLSNLIDSHRTDDDDHVHGLRIICAIWIGSVHSWMTLNNISDNKQQNSGLFSLEFIKSSHTLAIDMFFYLSGITLANMFCNSIQDISQDINRLHGAFGQLVHYIMLILQKILRLILPYTIVLLIVAMTMRHLNDRSVHELSARDHLTCNGNLWGSIFYMDTFYPLQERCMPWSWIVSIEVQFFVVACLVMMLSNNHPRFAFIIFSAFFVSSMTTVAIMADRSSHQLPLTENTTEEDRFAEFNGVLPQPWIRIGPYLIGVLVGYQMYKVGWHVNIHCAFKIIGWLLTATMFCLAIFGKSYLGHSHDWVMTTISAFSYIVWWWMLVWTSLHKGFIGKLISLRFLSSIDRLANCLLLIHPLICRAILFGIAASLHLTVGLVITIQIGLAAISLCASFLLYLLFEAPLLGLIKFNYKH